MDLEALLKDYHNKIHLRATDGGAYLVMPIFRFGQYESMELKF